MRRRRLNERVKWIGSNQSAMMSSAIALCPLVLVGKAGLRFRIKFTLAVGLQISGEKWLAFTEVMIYGAFP